ncbi:MAG TPA: outer membrane lipoprotein carrier protein LolA [Nitrospirota bacterium]
MLNFLLAAMLLFSFAADKAQAKPAQDVVTLIEKHYEQVSDLTARVSQKNILKAVGKTQKFEGTLLIKKPGKLRIDYTNGQLILVDGKAAMFYSKKSEQMVKKKFTDIAEMNIPVAFLLGASHLRDDFDVLPPDQKVPHAIGLLPKKPGAAMKKLRLISDDEGRITGLTIFDRSGNTTEIEFTDIREGGGIDDKQFAFTAPKGTEIIEQ